MRRPRVGLLVPFVPFYEAIVPLRDEKLAFAADVASRLARTCDLEPSGGDVGRWLVESEREAHDAGERFAAARVDAVVVAPALAAFGGLAWTALELLPRTPVAIWQPPLADTVPAGYEIGSLIRHSAGLSVMAIGNTLARHARAYRVFYGPEAGSDDLAPGLETFCRVAAVATTLRAGTLLRMGSVFPAMTDVTMDGATWRAEMGGRIVDIGTRELHARFARVDAGRVDVRLQQCGGVSRTGLSEEELTRSVRLALALEEAAIEHDAIGGAFNCHGDNCLRHADIGVTACLGVSWMAGAGRPFSCTGDLPTAVALVIAKQLSGTAIYGELDFVDVRRDCVLLANGGEHDVAVDGDGYALFGNENFAGEAGRGASIAALAPIGPTTLISFTPLDGVDGHVRYRVVAADGAIETDDRPSLRGFHAAFRFANSSASQAFVRWCEAGATHHLAVAVGHWCDAVAILADLCGWDARLFGAVRTGA
jgi:L-fucose isomerase-like protein